MHHLCKHLCMDLKYIVRTIDPIAWDMDSCHGYSISVCSWKNYSHGHVIDFYNNSKKMISQSLRKWKSKSIIHINDFRCTDLSIKKSKK